MNQGIEVVLPVGHACGTNALLPPMLWTSSVENSCRTPVFATAATQSLLSSTTSGALAPFSDGRSAILVALTSMSGCAAWKAAAASGAPLVRYQKLIVVAALGAFDWPPHPAARSMATAPGASHLILSVTPIVTGPCAGGGQALRVAGH